DPPGEVGDAELVGIPDAAAGDGHEQAQHGDGGGGQPCPNDPAPALDRPLGTRAGTTARRAGIVADHCRADLSRVRPRRERARAAALRRPSAHEASTFSRKTAALVTIDRFGTVAILGRSNVGKSTFLNAALGQHLAIVSPRPQTTRDALLGVAEHGNAQIAFIDTPGLHRPKSELGRRMNAAALEAARSADLVLFMTDVTGLRQR